MADTKEAGLDTKGQDVIWAITGFMDEEAPHWEVAYIEAPTAESAMETLWIIVNDDSRRPETIHSAEQLVPRSQWRAVEAIRPFTFILGGWCR